jgi:hypothetical protein
LSRHRARSPFPEASTADITKSWIQSQAQTGSIAIQEVLQRQGNGD